LLYVIGFIFLRNNFPTVTLSFAAVSITAFVIHFLVEGYRWHMLPAYSLLIFSVALTLKNKFVPIRESGYRKKIRIMAGAIGMLLLITAVSLPAYVFPIFKFEKPSGPYVVGTVSRYWIDHSRHRDRPREALIPRELMVQIWYPAQPARSLMTAPYHPNINYLTEELARTFGLPD
jgi:predicted dienelactone hydrolase